MRRWLSAALRAGDIAEWPAAWIPGGLAWLAVLGWLPLAVTLVPAPAQSALTHFGAGMRTSGAWPLNLVLLLTGAVALIAVAAALAAIGNAVLLGRISGRDVEPSDAGRMLGAAVVFGLPALIGAGIVIIAVAAVAPAEFNRGGASLDPVTRTALRIAPLLLFTGFLAVAGTVLAGIAGRVAVRHRSLADGLVRALGVARATGVPGAIHAIVSVVLASVYVVVGGLLTRVLWAPIGARLTGGEMADTGTILLLVGFVAVWLCIVLGGGALHAWATATWTLLDRMETASMDPRAPEATWRS